MGDFLSTYLACISMAWRGEKVRETKGFLRLTFAIADACKVLKIICLIFFNRFGVCKQTRQRSILLDSLFVVVNICRLFYGCTFLACNVNMQSYLLFICSWRLPIREATKCR